MPGPAVARRPACPSPFAACAEPELRRAVTRRLRSGWPGASAQDLEDAYQDAVVAMLTRERRGRPEVRPRAVRGWLHCVAWRQIRSGYRRRSRGIEVPGDVDRMCGWSLEEDVAVRDWLEVQVREAATPPDERAADLRDALFMILIVRWRVGEAATRYGFSRGYLSRILRQIRRDLADERA